MADRATDDPAQHITPAFVRRQHAIDDQEAAGADMVRDHAQRRILQVCDAGEIGRGLDDVREQVDVVVVLHALHDGRKALEAGARIDRRLRQRHELSVGAALELHEHEVPDLDITIAVFIGRTRRATRDVRAVVVEDLAAGAAGTGVAHRPEVGLLAEAGQPVRWDTDLLDPDVGGLVIVLVDGDPEAVRIELQRAGDEIPSEADRIALEVVTEGEIAEHLEERVMPGRVADVLEVVVLAAGPHAALRTRRADVVALFLAEEQILELHHAGIGEQQRRVVARHQRTGGDLRMPARGEEIEEGPTHLRRAHERRRPVGGLGSHSHGMSDVRVEVFAEGEPDMIRRKAPVLQKLGLSDLLGPLRRELGPELAPARIAGPLWPVLGLQGGFVQRRGHAEGG